MFKKIIGLWFPSKGKNAKDIKQYVKSLVESWAWEFFTWYNPKYWSEKFGFEVSPNGRFAEHEQITEFETLKIVVDEVHSYGIEIFWNLNFRYYTDETMPYIARMVEEFQSVWVDGIICGNIWVLEYLKKIGYQWKINISTILAVYNSEAIRFLLDNYTINKIILSREITLKEIEQILTEFTNVTFEVFGEGDFCRYNNGLCFAEHKYTTRDICTVVVNDLIIKKRYHPDFKKIILDETLSNIEKIEKLSTTYQDIFEKIEDILEKITLWFEKEVFLQKRLLNIIERSKSRVDLYFDALRPVTDRHNKNIITYFKWVKYLLQNWELSLQIIHDEIEQSIKSWIQYLKQKSQNIGWEAKLKALELASFYAKWDNLNLYSYLFFSKFTNLDTVKFPTRGRNYAEKIALIEKVLQDWKVSTELIDRGVSIERVHYDLTYLFGEKLWFRKLINNLT